VLAVAHFHRQELDAFFAEAERTIALNPNNVGILAGLGMRFEQAGDERGIALVRKAMKLDPFLPTIFNMPVAAHYFERGEYKEALVAARKINIPGFFPTQMFLAMIYTELKRPSDARAAVKELLRLRPGYTIETYVEESRRINIPDDRIRRFSAALRKAGLPEGTEA
jgi:adenylate cyclase